MIDDQAPDTPDHAGCEAAVKARLAGIETALVDNQEPCSVEAFGRRYPAKFLCIVEYVDAEGGRQLAAHFPDGIEPWETLGMVEAVKAVLT